MSEPKYMGLELWLIAMCLIATNFTITIGVAWRLDRIAAALETIAKCEGLRK